MSDPVMMKCGCASSSVRTMTNGVKHDPMPSCMVHDCLEVAERPPDLSARKARCAYHGSTLTPRRYRNNECNYGGCKAGKCTCEQPSSAKLPFFEHKPSENFDKFYCGCHGWD